MSETTPSEFEEEYLKQIHGKVMDSLNQKGKRGFTIPFGMDLNLMDGLSHEVSVHKDLILITGH